jgi:hypothetical protein
LKFPGLAAYNLRSRNPVSELLTEEYKKRRGISFNVLALGKVKQKC